MKKKVLMGMVVGCLLLVILYSHKPLILPNNGPKNATAYIENLGYRIVEYSGQEEVVYTKETIRGVDVRLFMLMDVEIDTFFDKIITVDHFIVTDHPLDNDMGRLFSDISYGYKVRFPNKTRVTTVSFNGVVINGYSNQYLAGERRLGSSTWDINGVSLEKRMHLSYIDTSSIVTETYEKIKAELN